MAIVGQLITTPARSLSRAPDSAATAVTMPTVRDRPGRLGLALSQPQTRSSRSRAKAPRWLQGGALHAGRPTPRSGGPQAAGEWLDEQRVRLDPRLLRAMALLVIEGRQGATDTSTRGDDLGGDDDLRRFAPSMGMMIDSSPPPHHIAPVSATRSRGLATSARQTKDPDVRPSRDRRRRRSAAIPFTTGPPSWW